VGISGEYVGGKRLIQVHLSPAHTGDTVEFATVDIVETVPLWLRSHGRQGRKDIRHSGDKITHFRQRRPS